MKRREIAEVFGKGVRIGVDGEHGGLAVIGATGSIGEQTLDVVRAHPDRFRVVGLAARSKWRELFARAREFKPRVVVLTDESLASSIDRGELPAGVELRFGDRAAVELATRDDVDCVVAAVVGAAGLKSSLAAAEAGKRLALANKETMVVAGEIVMKAARASGAVVIPVDSEHSAIFQCLAAGRPDEVETVILTGSGGPFRTMPLDRFESITPAEALNHPTWNMGPKITVDSATMMNKALEVIEAARLFDLDAGRIRVLIHPQSMIHSMVEYRDGSVIAQLSPPDMRLPIQYALTYPRRIEGPARRLRLESLSRWDFEIPERERYPALDLGFRVVNEGGTAGAALNAANEVAVERFLAGEIRFRKIVELSARILDAHSFIRNPTLDELIRADQLARSEARRWIS